MKAVVATMRGAFAEARANPSAFWSQMAAMVINDVMWIVFWVLFFGRVRVVRGWDQDRVLLMLAVLTTGGGLVMSVLANARRIGVLVVDGGIDAVLALPTRPLPHLLVRRVDAVNLGDVAFGVALFAVAGHPTVTRTALYAIGSAAGAVILASFLVITGSVTFFTNRGEAGDLGFHAMLLLGAYPVDIFGGLTKTLLVTVVPAGLIAAVPARLVDDFDPLRASALVAGAAVFALVASTVFAAGLRRYTSTSSWTRA